MSATGLIKSGVAFAKSLFKSSAKSTARTVGKKVPLKNGECIFDTNGKLMSAKTYYKDGSLKSSASYNKLGQLEVKETNLINGKKEYIENKYRYGYLTYSSTSTGYPGGKFEDIDKFFRYDKNGKLQSIVTKEYLQSNNGVKETIQTIQK